MDIGLHFLMPEIGLPDDWVQREHWLALAETVHDHLSIAMEGYTITVQGQNGHEFAFDFCLDIEKWGAPGTLPRTKRGRRPLPQADSWKWAPPAYPYVTMSLTHWANTGPAPTTFPSTGARPAYTHDHLFASTTWLGLFLQRAVAYSPLH